jgi:uncharacterized protein (TIGR03086 family)
MTSPIDRLATAVPVTGNLVEAIEPDQWALPTPCPEWTVRALVNHLVFGHRRFAAALTGGTPPSPGDDLLGSDPGTAYRASGEAMLAAFRAEGALERPVAIPAGTLPGFVACELRVVEALVHGWDLARTTGRTLEFPADMVERSIAFSRMQLGRLPADRTPFGPSQPVGDEAPALDRLAALLGRSIDRSGRG